MSLQQQRSLLSPRNWDRRRLKHHLSGFFGGGTPSKENEEFWTGGSIPWVSPKDMKTRRISSAEDSITPEAVAQSATTMVSVNSVLMVVRSGILKHSLPVAINAVPVALNQDMKAFRFRKSLSERFFAYWIEGQAKNLLLEWGQIGATVDNIDVDAMLNSEIPLPDLKAQEAIADFLDRETARIDELIEKKQRLATVLMQKDRALLHHMFASLSAPVWRARHLGKLRNGAGFPIDRQGDSSNEVPFFKVKHLKNFGLDAEILHSDDTITKETARELRATIFPAGTIVFAKIGAALLLARFSMIGVNACLDNNLAAFIPREQIILPDYALLALSQIDMAIMVQPGAVPSMDTEEFYNFSTPLPSLRDQEEFVERYRKARTRSADITRKVEQSIDRLREYRSALITAAVTGQIDVTTYGRRGATSATLDRIEEEMQA